MSFSDKTSESVEIIEEDEMAEMVSDVCRSEQATGPRRAAGMHFQAEHGHGADRADGGLWRRTWPSSRTSDAEGDAEVRENGERRWRSFSDALPSPRSWASSKRILEPRGLHSYEDAVPTGGDLEDPPSTKNHA